MTSYRFRDKTVNKYLPLPKTTNQYVTLFVGKITLNCAHFSQGWALSVSVLMLVVNIGLRVYSGISRPIPDERLVRLETEKSRLKPQPCFSPIV